MNPNEDADLCDCIIQAALNWFQARHPAEEVRLRVKTLEAVEALVNHRQ